MTDALSILGWLAYVVSAIAAWVLAGYCIALGLAP